KKKSGRAVGAARSDIISRKVERSAAEQRQDRLRVAVGDRQRLNAELLLDLKGLQTGRLLVHVGIDQCADALVDRVAQVGEEALLSVDTRLGGAKRGSTRGEFGKRGFNA